MESWHRCINRPHSQLRKSGGRFARRRLAGCIVESDLRQVGPGRFVSARLQGQQQVTGDVERPFVDAGRRRPDFGDVGVVLLLLLRLRFGD